MTVRFLGQSGYVLQTETTRIIIDPYLSDSVNRVAGRPRLLPVPIRPQDISCDAVICTHDHLDHLDPDTVSLINPRQLFVTTKGGRETLKGLGQENVIALSEGDTVKLGDMELTAVFADHTVEAFGLVVRTEGKTLYFSGDTLYNERLFDLAAYRPNVTFICINGRLGNMDAEQALITAKKIGAPINVPNHYDMFASNSEDPHLFADRIDGGFIMEFDRTYRIADTITEA
ncbi:MAG: MBL fold metallo-hydrolase [Oscillospiraceae bacterium]|nr:MBL fold metallo-hydrolase [Oscillospiraceae bacterium]